MATAEHDRRFRARSRRLALAAARFDRRGPLERDAARDLAALRRDPDVLDEAGLLPPARRYDWLAEQVAAERGPR